MSLLTADTTHQTTDIHIRRAHRADLPELLDMGYELYLVEKQFEPLMTFSKQEAQDRYDRQIDDSTCLFLILEVGDQTAGYLYAHLDHLEYMDTAQPECEIEVIYIKPEFRGLRASILLIEEAVVWAKSKHAWRIKTEIFAENRASLKAFKQHGFNNHHITQILELPQKREG